MKLTKDKINKSFTRAAKKYDNYSFIQNYIADKMMLFTDDLKFEKILEIGTGTGNYAVRLKNKYRKAELHLIDFSDEMLSIARDKLQKFSNIKYYNLDAENTEEYIFPDKFDLITSNSTFQWFSNLELYLKNIIHFLSHNGMILFSYFGNMTFLELNKIMKVYYKDINFSLPAEKFYNASSLNNILNRLNYKYTITEYIKTVKYENLFSLFKEIQNTGENGYGANKKIFLTKKKIKQLEKLYLNNFNRIVATYHFFIIKLYKN